ncbi:uncharacterized protein J7T54_007764 [Emericellopsis cladophorae]|uniref:Uncharacterized protein n=1 Tax=Emericellopsis cladophorae TaxID=2686198 RepID=A0A9Q0BAW3_9HYPO|nr:uncharacterized protein J7T54_007764 [Emericellopsis cladophorae]KAI6779237.1 hypothetical protein J7T54_007764 [Emericellopsis cladophorae]
MTANPITLSLAIILATLASAKLVWELLFSPLRAFPGDVDRKHLAWHHKWGSAVRVGPNAISLNDPDLIKTLYGTKNPWRKSDMYRPNDVVVNGARIQNIFNTQDKKFHAKYARPIGGFWTLSKVLELEPLFDETIRLLVSRLNDGFAEKRAVCMMDNWLAYFAWDAAANVSFGRHYGFIEEGEDIGGIINESTAGLKYFSAISQIPWLDNWLDKNPWYRIGPRPLVNGFLYTVRILSEYQQQVASGAVKRKKQDLFIDNYNGLKEKYDFVDDQQVIYWLMLNVLAGGDSTAGAMRPIFYHLAKNRDKYEKLVRELDGAELSFPAQWKDCSKLPYLDACVREAFRVNPAVALMLEREVPAEGFTIPDGRFIPAGTKVGLNPAVVTRDSGVFGEYVEKYVPERWLQKEGESDVDFVTRLRRMQETTDLMFGAGSRVCMGKHLARLEMYKLVATLYSTFDVKLEDPRHEWTYCNAWFMYHSDMPMILTARENFS